MGNRANGKAATCCAIYTRKSSEEGLEQDFNSLDAQRESCEAFILSQKHEGWIALPEMYDDGGVSGATMERPALKRLLSDIEAGRIDTVVVYKVDRLTRSLGDFAKIVEVFDTRGVSFVSVTQQFNTTTSMSDRRRLRAGRSMVAPETPPSSYISGSAIQPSCFWLRIKASQDSRCASSELKSCSRPSSEDLRV